MSWVKRNLYFLVGGIVAVALLGLAGYYCYSKMQLNNQKLEELNKLYADWTRIVGLPVSPGNDQVDNIANARDQQKKVRDKIRDVRKYYVAIPAIPDPADVAARKEDFATAFRSALRRTIDQLQRDAANNSVTLSQPDYSFSFKWQRNQYNFAAGSLGPLSVQLGEVKSICAVLFQAKINALDNLQRERVSADDVNNTSPQDYLELSHTSVTNELAILTPYVVTFRCFSPELASVLSALGTNPHGFIVKTLNVEPAAGVATIGPGGEMITGGTPSLSDPSSATGGYPPYGTSGGYPPYRPTGGYPPYGGGYPTPPPANPAVAPTTGPRGGLPTVLDEKQLRVTLVVNVVKLLPKK